MLEHNHKLPQIKRYIKENRNFSYNCASNSSCSAYEINIAPGVYLLEVWGAKGGDGFFSNFHRPGGAGGYSRGIINIKQTRTMFVTIGGSGSSIINAVAVDGGNNGGGNNSDSRTDYYKSSGGGATDIRLDVNNVYHRILVAGGGGGGNAATCGNAANGGVGGGIEGGKSPGHYGPFSSTYNFSDGTGGTQTRGGVMGEIACHASHVNTAPQQNGTFGFGGNVIGSNIMSGPGGGGWYGGGAGNGHGGAGGGGSGFVLNQTSSVNTPSGYAFTNSNDIYLMDGYTLSGNQNFASPQGNILIGNNGHGYARITLLEENKNKNRNDCFTFNGMRYVHPFAKQYFIHFITHIISS
jgi:hypothetical protein